MKQAPKHNPFVLGFVKLTAYLPAMLFFKPKVYYMDKNLYNLKPNHRWGEAYEKLEAILADG